jgi:hypothetical protein
VKRNESTYIVKEDAEMEAPLSVRLIVIIVAVSLSKVLITKSFAK